MPATSSQPATQSARIDWRKAASLLVGGLWPEQVAERLGIDEQRVWRHLRKSKQFRHYIRQALERRRLVLQLHFAAGIPAALQAFSPAGGQDMAWLVETLGIGVEATHQRARERREQDQGDVVDRLGATGDPPPRTVEQQQLKAENEQEGRQAQRPDLSSTARLHATPSRVTPSQQTPSLAGESDLAVLAAAASLGGRPPAHMLGGG